MKKFTLGRLSQFLTLLTLSFAFANVQANSYPWEPESYSPVRIDVIDDNGRILNQYSADSYDYKTQRTYLEAIKGKRYKLRIQNTSNKRIGVVVAVDGRNILSGKKSYLRSNEKMYVLDPYESADYKGWRTAQNRVNRFYFTSAGDSYASAWGDRSAMGVIAVAVFNEKRRYYSRPDRRNHSNRVAPSARGSLSGKSTGTGFGREEYSPTIKVRFKAKNRPSFKHFFKYEWRQTLCQRGIARCNYYEDDYRNKNRFWPQEVHKSYKRRDHYAPYPPNYRVRKWGDVVTTDRNWDMRYKQEW